MRRPTRLFLLLLLAACGCSRGGSPAAPPGEEDDPTAQAWPVATLPKLGWVEVPLVMASDRLFEVQAELDGQKLLLLVDSGASQLILDRKVADRFKLKLERAPWSAGGLGTSSVEAYITQLNTFKIGSYASVPVESWVMDLSHVNDTRTQRGDKRVDGVLGAAFLDFHGGVIDYPNRKLYLRPRQVETKTDPKGEPES